MRLSQKPSFRAALQKFIPRKHRVRHAAQECSAGLDGSPWCFGCAQGAIILTVYTKKQIHAESRLSLPRFSFPRFFILFLQRFRGVGAKGPEIEFLEIASAFLVPRFFLVHTVDWLLYVRVVSTRDRCGICTPELGEPFGDRTSSMRARRKRRRVRGQICGSV